MKTEKHNKAQQFRARIALSTERKQQIVKFLSKESFSETDLMLLGLLFQKTTYLKGCESEYFRLINKVRNEVKNPSLVAKVETFYKRLNED